MGLTTFCFNSPIPPISSLYSPPPPRKGQKHSLDNFCITDRASPSISTTNSPRSNPSRIAWRHTIASATKTYTSKLILADDPFGAVHPPGSITRPGL
ncbi:hypothetical protein ERO13_A13G069750v2 [Gossypium hirsutum]|uniref:Uncharacterized protein isoform X2 n=2 Tax=Gossypium TaxID=3633 RepID=A0A1U8LXH7_GOSHI|nr:uncharacterized protein LOC107930751 isoform X2 [Gossypium hirsutum]KAB2047862.1 hypothetical protein ES319_A13G075200v1 [Gossypium barbadense]KAG4165284.1 hypothetical protein ERO13_A13G069750v2 [Gossypium hirsutum]